MPRTNPTETEREIEVEQSNKIDTADPRLTGTGSTVILGLYLTFDPEQNRISVNDRMMTIGINPKFLYLIAAAADKNGKMNEDDYFDDPSYEALKTAVSDKFTTLSSISGINWDKILLTDHDLKHAAQARVKAMEDIWSFDRGVSVQPMSRDKYALYMKV